MKDTNTSLRRSGMMPGELTKKNNKIQRIIVKHLQTITQM